MRPIRLLSLLLPVVLLCGCASTEVLIQPVGPDGRLSYGEKLSGSETSSGALNLLGNLLLQEEFLQDPSAALIRLIELGKTTDKERLPLAIAELSLAAGRAGGDVRSYLTAMFYAHSFLVNFDEPESEPYSPDRLRCMHVYNLAATQVVDYLRANKLLFCGGFKMTLLTGEVIRFAPMDFQLAFAPEELREPELCADFRVQNLTHISYRFGIGVPTVWSVAAADSGKMQQMRAGQTLPATIVGDFTALQGGEEQYELRLHCVDVWQKDTFSFGKGREIPLELDYSTALVYMAKPDSLLKRLQYMLLPEENASLQGLYQMQPYDPGRIPVVFVHGLLSDLRTWMQMVNTLQNDPLLREHYQFLGYTYSSGNPILLSAGRFRQDLDRWVAARRAEFPENRLDEMVVVGHSMGGLLTKTLLMDADAHTFGELYGSKATDWSRKLTAEQQDLITSLISLQVRDYVKRVVFIAVPHRGSQMALSWLGRLGSSLVKLPRNFVKNTAEMAQAILKSRTQQDLQMQRIENGIDALAPTSRTVEYLNRIPLTSRIPYHSIIGNHEVADMPGGTDGIVPYHSSHLDGAVSEVIVHSGHSAQQNPLAIHEMRRILHLHLQESRR
ncbi:MAG: alpha/beta fold hydrolase [Lentisphaeria bacterium]|nr:alpha/beta fold hydrolase [Lentisphaeria bacterium]